MSSRLDRLYALRTRARDLRGKTTDRHLLNQLDSAMSAIAAGLVAEAKGHVRKASSHEDFAYGKIGFVDEELGRASRRNPRSSGEDMARRTLSARARFIEHVRETIGCSESDAARVFDYYRKAKIVSSRHVTAGGLYEVKHGAFWEPEVLQRALDESRKLERGNPRRRKKRNPATCSYCAPSGIGPRAEWFARKAAGKTSSWVALACDRCKSHRQHDHAWRRIRYFTRPGAGR